MPNQVHRHVEENVMPHLGSFLTPWLRSQNLLQETFLNSCLNGLEKFSEII